MQLNLSSNELFSVLDEASENTFLSTNATANMQKFLFDGDADKVATELKNVVSCASYMLEKKLVSWCDFVQKDICIWPLSYIIFSP